MAIVGPGSDGEIFDVAGHRYYGGHVVELGQDEGTQGAQGEDRGGGEGLNATCAWWRLVGIGRSRCVVASGRGRGGYR